MGPGLGSALLEAPHTSSGWLQVCHTVVLYCCLQGYLELLLIHCLIGVNTVFFFHCDQINQHDNPGNLRAKELHACHQCSCFYEDLNMIALIGTSNQPCWLAEACKLLLLPLYLM